MSSHAIVHGMERLETRTADSNETVVEEEEEEEEEAVGRMCETPEKLPDEEYLSLEFEDYNFVCATETPSFDEISEVEEINDTPLWVVGQQIYNEFQWSDSDQSEVDFELSVKPGLENEIGSIFETSHSKQKKNKIKYLKIKSGNIAKKIRLNISDLSNNYLDKVKRLENYKRFLKMISRILEKGEDAPVIVTPDESELQGMTEEEKENKRKLWQQDLAKLEEEIQTLRHVLQSKVRESQDLKRKLGISVWKEFTDDLSHGVRSVKETNVYQNVEEKFNQLGKAVTDAPIYQKTESVVKATAEGTRSLIGGLTGGFTQKIGQLKNSESFRSLEEKVGSAYENVKTKVSSRSNSVQNFGDVLHGENVSRSSSVTSPVIPEEKALH